MKQLINAVNMCLLTKTVEIQYLFRLAIIGYDYDIEHITDSSMFLLYVLWPTPFKVSIMNTLVDS